MTQIGKASLIEQTADQLIRAINEAIKDEDVRQHLAGTVRGVVKQAVDEIMSTPEDVVSLWREQAANQQPDRACKQ
jgi:hypothetical protein